MSFFKFNKLGFMVAGAALLAFAVTQGCSSDDDSQAMPGGGAGSAGTAGKSGSGNGESGSVNGEGGSGDSTGEGGSGNVGNSTSNGGDAGSGNVGNVGNVGNEAGTGGEAGGAVGPSCTAASGCYSCAPTNSIQFENGCVTGGCPDTFTDKLSKIAVVGTL
ncbi:MAG: hypothetical protein ABI548_04245 [Polyangiaceae bacterium]